MPPRRWIPVVALAFAAFYIGLYFWGTHSDGYRFLGHAVRKSPAIRQLVGDVQSVRLSVLGGYSEKFVNSETTKSRTVPMTLNVIGTKKGLSVKAIAKEADGIWTVSDASIGGQRINLN
jgi:hypothetical protein